MCFNRLVTDSVKMILVEARTMHSIRDQRWKRGKGNYREGEREGREYKGSEGRGKGRGGDTYIR